MLEISLLGSPDIRLDGAPVPSFESRTAEAVLYYLASSPGAHARESLAELFWPERSQEQSQSNLRTVLHRLRRALDPYLVVTRSSVTLPDDAHVSVDARLVEFAMRPLESEPFTPASAETLEHALAQIRGPFLDGFSLSNSPAFEDWMLVQREFWQVHATAGLEALASYYLEQRIFLPAFTLASRLVDYDPLRESSTALLMRLFAEAGQPVRAHEAYVRLSQRLDEELGVAPSEALRRLDARIGESPASRENAYPVSLVPGAADLYNPYKGLLPFDESDAAHYFGRQQLLDDVLTRLSQPDSSRLLALVGASGMGKSSFVRAALMPALKRQGKSGVAIMAPGSQPLEALQELLRRELGRPDSSPDDSMHAGSPLQRPFVLIVDQLEELFTQGADADTQASFLDQLTALVDDNASVAVVVTLRADFYDRPLAYPEFGRRMARATIPVLPMTAPELEQAILAPAIQAGLAFEEGLVAQIIADVNARPGALPLMQVTLMTLADRRQGRFLTWHAYHSIGGVAGALVQRAEASYEGLSPDEQEAVQTLFLRLVVVGEQQLDTRRRLADVEVRGGIDGAVFKHIVDTFTRERLLISDYNLATGVATIEIAHEALISAWDRFRTWVETYRLELLQYRQLGVMAIHWHEADSDASYLATGSRLAQFEALLDSPLILSDMERAFVRASQLERDRLSDDERRRHATEKALRLAVNSSLILNRGASGELPALLALESLDLAYTPTGDSALLSALQQPLLRQRFNGHFFRTQSIAVLNEGELLVTGGQDRTVRVWESLSGTTTLVIREFDQPVVHLARSSDGLHFAAGFSGHAVRIWTAGLAEPWAVLDGHSAPVCCVAWSDDDRALAVGCTDGSVTLWDLDTMATRWSARPHPTSVLGVAFGGPEGQVWSHSDHQVVANRVTDGAWRVDAEVRPAAITRMCVAPDGGTIALGCEDGTVLLWDGVEGSAMRSLFAFRSPISALWIDSDTITAAHRGGQIHLWRAADGAPMWTQRFPDEIWCAAQDESCQTLYLGGSPNGDFQAYVWQPLAQREPQLLLGHTDVVTTTIFSPDGQRVLSTSWDGTIRVWDLESGLTRSTLVNPGRTSLFGLAISGDGRFLLSTSDDGAVQLWDLATGDLVRTFEGHTASLTGVAVTRDGRFALSAGHDRTMRLWDTSSGQQIRCFMGHQDSVFRVCFSPDESLAFSPSADHTARLWNVATGECVREFTGHRDWVVGSAFSPDGRTVVTTSVDRTARLWDASTGDCLRIFAGHTAFVRSVAFSPDGRTFATGSDDRTIRLWEVDSGQQVRIFTGHEGNVWHLRFSPDGRFIASPSADRTIRIWRVDIHDVEAHSRAILPRELTDAERAQYGVD